MKNRLKQIALSFFVFLYDNGSFIATIFAVAALLVGAAFFQMTTGLPWYVFLIISGIVIVSNSGGG